MTAQTLRQIRQKQRAAAKAWREKNKDTPEYKAKQKERWDRWRDKNKSSKEENPSE